MSRSSSRESMSAKAALRCAEATSAESPSPRVKSRVVTKIRQYVTVSCRQRRSWTEPTWGAGHSSIKPRCGVSQLSLGRVMDFILQPWPFFVVIICQLDESSAAGGHRLPASRELGAQSAVRQETHPAGRRPAPAARRKKQDSGSEATGGSGHALHA